MSDSTSHQRKLRPSKGGRSANHHAARGKASAKRVEARMIRRVVRRELARFCESLEG